MTKSGQLLAGLAAVLLSTTSAGAADLGGPRGGSIKDGYVPHVVDQGGARFYLRGDYAHAWQSMGNLTEPPNYDLTLTSMANTSAWGLGVGYYFSKSVRGDLTFDWRKSATVRGSITDLNATVPGERTFGVKNMVALANLYYDFDIRSHFTPYVGVGLGFARNTTTAGSVAVVPNLSSACATTPATVTCTADFEGASKTTAAGALMAGFTARLHDRMHIDAGYRFLYLGNANTGAIRATSTDTTTPPPVVTTTTLNPISLHDQSAHEFRVGVRWDIK